MNPIQAMAVAAMLFSEQGASVQEPASSPMQPFFGARPAARYAPRSSGPTVKGGWDKAVARRKRHLDARKRQKQARKRQRRK